MHSVCQEINKIEEYHLFSSYRGGAKRVTVFCHFYLQRQRRSVPDNSCCGEKVQNRGLEASMAIDNYITIAGNVK